MVKSKNYVKINLKENIFSSTFLKGGGPAKGYNVEKDWRDKQIISCDKEVGRDLERWGQALTFKKLHDLNN